MTVPRRSSVPRSARARRAVRARTVLVGLVVGVLALLAVPASPASAHAALAGTSPAQNSVVAQAPTQVVLTFTEGVTPVTDRVHVIGPDGSKADSGEPRTSGDQLIIPLKPGSLKGTFLVNYRVISADSHPIGGAYTYSVGAPSPGGPPTETAGDQSPNPVIRAAFPVARWIGYVGLLLLVGAVLVLMLLWPKRLDRRDPIRVIWIGAGMVALATVLELMLQIPYVAGGALTNFRAVDVREVLASQFGAAHLIRLGVLAAALVLLRPIVRGKGWGADRVLLAVLGAIGVATWSVSGHPSASSVPMVTVVADMIHIASMSVWLGGLVMLIGFLLPRATGRELAAIIPIWSRWAAYAVSALVLTGVTQALVEIGDLSGLFTTTYGWLLIAKIGLVGVALAVASQSRRLVPIIASVLHDPAAEDAESDNPRTEDGETDESDIAEEAGIDADDMSPAGADAGRSGPARADRILSAVPSARAAAASSGGSLAVKSTVAAGGNGAGPTNAGTDRLGSDSAGPDSAGPDSADLEGADSDAEGSEAGAGAVADPAAVAESANGAGPERASESDDVELGEQGDLRPPPVQRRAARRLRGLIVAEAVVAAVILGVTSVLVQTTPARSEVSQPAAAPSVQSATMKDKLFILTMDVEPASVGLNDVHMYVTTPDGQPANVKEWSVRASSPDQGIEPIDATVLAVQPDHAIGQIGLPSAGTWTFTFTLRTTEIDESTVTAQVVVSP